MRIDSFEEVAMYEEVGNIDDSAIYRDIAEAGGLGPAIQAQLTAIGSSLSMTKADPDTAGLFPFNWEAVRGNDRSSQIMVAKHNRLFMMDFWDKGVCLGHGSTPLILEVAEAMNAWIADTSSCQELQRRFPFVTFEAKAESHEQGAAAEVEQQWQSLLNRVRGEQHFCELVPLIEKAMEYSVLRRLFPFTSLISLCFGRCTGYPFSGDCPSACPSRWAVMQGYMKPEQRAVLGPEKPYTVASNGQFLGQGDAAEAIDLIIRHLPPNCGPAIQGTEDDLHASHRQ